MTPYQQFLAQIREISQLEEVMGILSWDQETMMPEGALESRSHQKANLAGLIHEKFTQPQLGDLARSIKQKLSADDQKDPYIAANLREFLRAYDRETKVPKRLVQEIKRTETTAHAAWVSARQNSKFAEFAPHLHTLLRLRKEESQAIDDKRSPYDVQLEKFEVGLSAEFVSTLFQKLKAGLIPFIHKITTAPKQPKPEILKGLFPRDKQQMFVVEVAKAMGFDFTRGRIDASVHPFCGGAGTFDVRMTTRYNEENLWESLFGTIHETGHALYEQGLDMTHLHEPVCCARSMGVHESQSLLWEKHVGLSREFWQFYFPRAQAIFGNVLRGVSFEDFYFALNEVRPSLIRVDADEVTYPLHVILRFELEQMLFNGQLKVDDLPQVWNEKMTEYLGLVPPNDALGVLQDVHWSMGLFGYFPTYNLGAIYASQIFHVADQKINGLGKQFVSGQFQNLKEWLNREIHQKGCLYETDELIHRVTGETINADFHLNRLREKYATLYGI